MRLFALCLCATLFCSAAQKKPVAKPKPIAKIPAAKVFSPVLLDAVNPHYFRFRNRTTVLVSSGVRLPDQDDAKFLDTLADSRLNYVRLRADERPAWQMTNGKYDLALWDESYFNRLRAFVAEADKRNIVVEITLFSVQYGSGRGGYGTWNTNPLNNANNSNHVGSVNWDRFNTMDDPRLVAAQDAVARRIVTTLSTFENVYYEICNQPQFSGATARETAAWLSHILAVVKDTEIKLGRVHLVMNGPAVPTSAVCNAVERRSEAWSSLLNGGSMYSQPGDCPETRYQLSILQAFLRRFELAALKPDRDAVRQWPLGASDAYVLTDPGRTYAIYLRSGDAKPRQSVLLFDLPAGRYQAEWVNPRTGDEDKADPQEHKGGLLRLITPEYTDDLALRLTSVRPR